MLDGIASWAPGQVLFEALDASETWRIRLWLPDEQSVLELAGRQHLEGYDDEDTISGLCDGDNPFSFPVWWIDDPECPEHDEDCRCGVSALADAVPMMRHDDVVDAIGAHVKVLADLGVHERAVTGIADGFVDEDDEDGVVAPMCVACLTEPDLHQLRLSGEVCDRAVDLAEALSLHDYKIVPANT